MEEMGLPERLFETGFEPTGRKRVHNYFTLRWVELIKPALDAEYIQKLTESQFSTVMKMGEHTFSVMFIHYLLCRQLATKKKYELWWVFSGKPVRYGLGEFAVVTGLNCEEPNGKPCTTNKKRKSIKNRKKKESTGKDTGPMWESLFGDIEDPTTSWILDRLLMGKKYKDPITRFRLALLLIVEGILCPTSKTTNIRAEVVEMVADIDAFLKYPWGRESFRLTVRSAKARTTSQYVQKTTAIQGFAHAIVLVAACSCPEIVGCKGGGDSIVSDVGSIEDVVKFVVERSFFVNVVTSKAVDQRGQACVRSMITDPKTWNESISYFEDEEHDPQVAHMVSLIAEEFPFEHNSWRGGVKASEVGHKNVTDDDVDDTDVEVAGDINDVGESCSNVRRIQKLTLKSYETRGVVGGTSDMKVGGIEEVDVSAMLKDLADGYEERTAHLLKGVYGSLEVHLDTVFDKLKAHIEALLKKEIRSIYDAHQQHYGGGFNTDGCSGNNSNGGEDVLNKDLLPGRTRFKSRKRDGRRLSRSKVHEAVEQLPTNVKGVTSPGYDDFGKNPRELITHQVVVPSEASETRLAGGTLKRKDDFDGELSEDNVKKRRSRTLVKASINVKGSTMDDLVSEHATKNKCRRFSKRTRSCPDRYTPAVSSHKKQKKSGAVNNKNRNVVDPVEFDDQEVVGQPSLSVTLIGGFNPFVEPDEEKLAAFDVAVSGNGVISLFDGSFVKAEIMKTLFDCANPIDTKVVEVLVHHAQVRCEYDSSARYDFLPAEFLPQMEREYIKFSSSDENGKFKFHSGVSLNYGKRRSVGPAVDMLYCPRKVDGHHWVGLCIDVTMCKITVLDCNLACISDEELENYLKHLAEMLPYLRCAGIGDDVDQLTRVKRFDITRLDLPFMCEIPGLSAVAAFVLMELHATDQLHCCENFDVGNLHTAARHYAVESLAVASG